MRTTAKLRLIAFGGAVLITLAGCSQAKNAAAPNSSGKITLGGVLPTITDPYYISIQCAADKEAKAKGVSITWKTSTTSDTAAAQANFQAATLLKPDGLLLSSFDAGTFSSQVKTLMSQGVPVVAVDGPITPSTELQYVHSGSDDADFIKYIGTQLKSSGSIGILSATPGADWATQRWSPLKKIVPSGVTILPPQYDNVDRNQAASATSAMMVANPDLQAVFAVSGPEGEGAAAAVKEAGKTGKIKVFAYDATPGELAALKAGSITALLAQPAGDIGKASVDTVLQAIKDRKAGSAIKPLSSQDKAIPLKVITADNVNKPETEPYLYKAHC